ncbi:TetR/AcrR family transcriptional regulator [Rhodococcus qingshengii]|uniref:TetR/AcrR family transcriptional regulator n=1 Tax=Rhodococcus qingshengii TaxID=334542 RepID=UPI00237C684B|nr:TetR family transcriptional regulator [Rhodococcus qingshengii]WCT05758.1 TetR family transcriptional regulator [Rhodococcus qingshengii]
MPTEAPKTDGHVRRATAPRRDRRQALIDATIELISEDGETDISAAAISRRADVAHGLLFYYFTDKQGLVTAALCDVLTKLAAFQSPKPEEHTTRERLEGFVRRHIEFLDNYRTVYIKMVRNGTLSDPEVVKVVQDAQAEGARQVARLVDLTEPLSPLTRAALAGWVGFLDRASDEYFDNPQLDLNQLIELTVSTLFSLIDALNHTHPAPFQKRTEAPQTTTEF